MADLSTAADQPIPPERPTVAELPTGAVTFVFTDIEGSTKLLLRQGEGYAAVLTDHQRLLRAAWAAHDGVEIDTQGDSFFVVFGRATEALAAAAQAQRALAAHPWPAGAPVRVRIGLHSGVGALANGHYVGLDVHRAARIAAAGHGGQVLLSQATRDQVAKELVAGAGLRDLGKHRLKDLPKREEIYQLLLPGMPNDHPPLKTLDAWPGLRADLVAVVLVVTVLLALIGPLLPVFDSTFPRWIGLGAAGLDALLLLASGVARPVRRALWSQWRNARKPFATVTSALLAVVVITTTLFITKPAIFPALAQHLGYDFSYTYHTPTHIGGKATVWVSGLTQTSLISWYLAQGNYVTAESYVGLWQTCVVQLPDAALGLKGWRADQCTEVPTIANGGESLDELTTTFRIDPRAVWSDGVPITAADYLFADKLAEDPNIGGGLDPVQQRTLTALDTNTVRIHWVHPYSDYLVLLARMPPMPLHAYAAGPFAGIFDPNTGVYNSALAQRLVHTASYNAALPVDNGPFVVQSFEPGYRADLVRNPRFFSNFFHQPALDGVALIFANPQWPDGPPGATLAQTAAIVYRNGAADLVDGFDPYGLSHFSGIPRDQVIISPRIGWKEIGFNQRTVAPNARANGDVSIFSDLTVRKAFVEAFDRCAAIRAQLGISDCNNPNLRTDEFSAPPAPDYDRSVMLPGYNPADAAHLMDLAGYPVVNGVRRNKDGSPLRLALDLSHGGSGVSTIGQIMRQDYERNLKIAVTVEIQQVFFTAPFTQPGAAAGTFDIALYDDTGDSDPVINAEAAIIGETVAADIPTAQNPGGLNFLGVVDSHITEQRKLGEQTPQGDQQNAVYIALQRYAAGRFYAEPVFLDANVTLTKPTLCNFKMSAVYPGNLWNIADWYLAPSCP